MAYWHPPRRAESATATALTAEAERAAAAQLARRAFDAATIHAESELQQVTRQLNMLSAAGIATRSCVPPPTSAPPPVGLPNLPPRYDEAPPLVPPPLTQQDVTRRAASTETHPVALTHDDVLRLAVRSEPRVVGSPRRRERILTMRGAQSGWMWKVSGKKRLGSRWQRRWFVLDGARFDYYDSDQCGTARGTIDLSQGLRVSAPGFAPTSDLDGSEFDVDQPRAAASSSSRSSLTAAHQGGGGGGGGGGGVPSHMQVWLPGPLMLQVT
jgi:hypothetical protein